MRATQKLAVASLAATLAFVGAACGDSGSDAGNKAAEKAIENATDGKVDYDSDSGKVTLEDDEGNQTEIDTSGGAELPADFPEELAPPDSVKIIAATTNTTDGKKSIFVNGATDTSVEDLASGLKTQLENADYEIVSDSTGSIDSGSYANITAKKGDIEVTASIADNPSGLDENGKTGVTMTVSGI